MSGIATAVVGGSVIGGLITSHAQSSAAKKAANAQTQASDASIEEQRRQFDKVQKLLKPYVSAGTGALGDLSQYQQAGSDALSQQRALLGLNGNAAQQSAINALSNSAQMKAYTQQGENAINQNAAATGGLRGGNAQAALAQYRPQMLANLISQQYSNLGGLTALGQQTTSNIAQLGQASAAGTASAAQNTGANVSTALQQSGAAQAGNALAQGQANANLGNTLANAATTLGTMYAMGKF